MRARLNQALLGVVGVAILAGSVAPLAGAAGGSAGRLSPLLHLAAYFMLAAALLLVFHDTPRGHVEAVAVAVLFGVGMELVQSMLPYRTAAVGDVLVNAVGASVVLLDHRVGLVHRVVAWEDRLIDRVV